MSEPRATTVLLTRSAEDNAEWADPLSARGFVALDVACIETVAIPAPADLARRVAAADWIAIASRRGADRLALECPDIDAATRLAAVGPATAERVRAHHGRCELVSEGGSGADLARALAAEAPRACLVVAARGGLADIERGLGRAGVATDRVELYETRPLTGTLPASVTDAAAAFFASPSAARAFAARADDSARAFAARANDAARALSPACVVVSIGPTTTAALRDVGLPVHAESRTRDLDGMITAYRAHLAEVRS